MIFFPGFHVHSILLVVIDGTQIYSFFFFHVVRYDIHLWGLGERLAPVSSIAGFPILYDVVSGHDFLDILRQLINQ